MQRILLAIALVLASEANAQLPVTIELVEELRIDGALGSESLTAVHPLAVDREGKRLYVGQRMENLVRIFDAENGQFIGRFGRHGSGPGEFQSMIQMGWTGDTLVIMDEVLLHASLFNSDGQHIRSDRIASPPIPGVGIATISAYLTNGTVLGYPSYSLSSVVAGELTHLPYVHMSRSGDVLRTLGYRDISGAAGLATIGDRIVLFQQPRSQTAFLTPAPAGDAFFLTRTPPPTGNRPTFTVTRFNVDGDTVYHRSYRYRPQPLPPSAFEAMDKAAERMFPGVPAARARQALRESTKLPPSQLPVSDVVAGWDGELWLRHAELADGGFLWITLAPDGGMIGMIQVPGELTIKAVQGTAVWGVVHDELDVPSVVRYRVKKIGG